MTTPNLQLAEPPDFATPIASEERDSARALDALGPGVIAVLSQATTAPPGGALQGARYIVPDGATGAWAGRARAVAYLTPEGWAFRAPRVGWVALVLDETVAVGDLALFTYQGTEWVRGTLDAASVGFDGYAVAGLDSTTVDDAILEVYDILGERIDDLVVRVEDLENASGGGGGGSGPTNPDTPPTIADPVDDEFEGGSIDSAWQWVNQGSAVARQEQGALILESSLTSGGTNNNLFVQTAPAAPWTIRAKFGGYLPTASAGCILAFYNSANQNVVVFGFYNNAGAPGFYVQRLDDPTTFNANVTFGTSGESWSGFVLNPIYLEVENDGTNLNFYWSRVGYNGVRSLVATEALATHLGAVTDFGFAVNGLSTSVRSMLFADSFRRID